MAHRCVHQFDTVRIGIAHVAEELIGQAG